VKHQIFVSHSHSDAPLAEQLVTALEKRDLLCWIAPRDVPAGGSYAAAILTALEESSCLVLIYTDRCNTSGHVLREVERAVYIGIDIIPLRFDASVVSKSLSYFLTSVHWLSVVSRPLNDDLEAAADRIANSVKSRPKEVALIGLVDHPTTPSSEKRSTHPATSRHLRNIAVPFAVALVGIVFGTLFLSEKHKERPPTPPHSAATATAAPTPGALIPPAKIQEFLPAIATPTPSESSAQTQAAAPSESPAVTQLPGERYPETRTRSLSRTELQTWTAGKLQYAINEIFARRGASFPDKKEIETWFRQFAWYKPKPNLTFDQIEASLPEVEKQNVKTLAEARQARTVSESALAGVWRGTITVRVTQGAGFLMPCELTFDERRKEVSSLVNVDKHRGGSTHPYTQKGNSIYFTWTVPNEPGTMINLVFTLTGNEKTASIRSEHVVRRQRIASGSGIFSKLE